MLKLKNVGISLLKTVTKVAIEVMPQPQIHSLAEESFFFQKSAAINTPADKLMAL
jgi:hypothetical protein